MCNPDIFQRIDNYPNPVEKHEAIHYRMPAAYGKVYRIRAVTPYTAHGIPLWSMCSTPGGKGNSSMACVPRSTPEMPSRFPQKEGFTSAGYDKPTGKIFVYCSTVCSIRPVLFACAGCYSKKANSRAGISCDCLVGSLQGSVSTLPSF